MTVAVTHTIHINLLCTHNTKCIAVEIKITVTALTVLEYFSHNINTHIHAHSICTLYISLMKRVTPGMQSYT